MERVRSTRIDGRRDGGRRACEDVVTAYRGRVWALLALLKCQGLAGQGTGIGCVRGQSNVSAVWGVSKRLKSPPKRVRRPQPQCLRG